jgi:ribosomal protein S18 acetylase RimI-like enzyme
MITRLATADDVAGIMDVEKEMFDLCIYERMPSEEIIGWINDDTAKIWICEDDGVIGGYALSIMLPNKKLWFASLAVIKKFQPMSAGKILFEKIELETILTNSECILLEIREDNKALKRRYTNMGYEYMETEEKYFPDGCGAYRMCKRTEDLKKQYNI